MSVCAAKIADHVFVDTDHGGHPAARCSAGLLHELPALRDKAQSGGEIESPGRGVRGELAEGETGRSRHGKIAQFLARNGQRGQSVHVEGGLADRGLGQFLLRSFPTDSAEGPSEDFIRLAEKIGGYRVSRGELFTHADGLGALSRKNECDFFVHAA